MTRKTAGICIYTAIVFITLLFQCMSNNIVGLLLGNIMRDYSINLAAGGVMAAFQNIGGALSIILLACIMDKLNKMAVLIVPLALLAISLLLIGSGLPFCIFLVSFLLFGIALATINMLVNAIVSDVHRENHNAALNLLHCVAPIGAIFIPVIIGNATEAGMPWQDIYIYVGIMMLVVTAGYSIAYAAMRSKLAAPGIHDTRILVKGTPISFFRDRRVWLAMICMLMHGCCHSGIVVWIVQYSKDVFHADAVLAGLGLTFFWLSTSVIRLLFGVTRLKKLNPLNVLALWSVLGGCALAAGVLSNNITVLLISMLVCGCCISPAIPAIVSLLTGWYHTRTGLASSAAFTMLYAANAVSPLLMGVVASMWGMQAMMFIPIIASCLSGFAAIPLLHTSGKRRAVSQSK